MSFDLYSDLYKDLTGVRPRVMPEDLDAEIASVIEQLKQQDAEELEYEHERKERARIAYKEFTDATPSIGALIMQKLSAR